MRVLIGCLYFGSLTGSEMYVYELSKGLQRIGNDVSIVSTIINSPLIKYTNDLGIKTYNLNELPNNINFDIIHSQHVPITQKLIELFPDTPKICSIHSEMYSIENPIIHPSIKKYIAIRPSIRDYMINNFNIKENDIEIIYNPIDENKFNKNNTQNGEYLLFVGSLDNIRKNTIFDLIVKTKNNNQELWIVGKEVLSDYLPIILRYSHVKYFQPTNNVAEFVKNCKETAGILLGRSTIEGWMCGKSGWIYDVNPEGKILNKTFHPPPQDIEKFYTSNVCNKIKGIYERILS
jgi:glycosyltransferase involved in cell wall biosynthesis